MLGTVNSDYVSIYSKKNVIATEKLNLCINDAKLGKSQWVYIQINMFLIDHHSYKSAFKNAQAHAIGAILDFKNISKPKLYLLDSGASDKFEYYYYLDSIEAGLSKYLYNHTKMNIDIVHPQVDNCPLVNLQGEIGSCATWAVYMFFAVVLNGERSKVVKCLSTLAQRQRDILISQFLFYMYKHMKVKINKKNEISKKEHIIILSAWNLI